VSGEAILSAENSGKLLGGRGSARTPLGERCELPRPPAGWEGVAAPSPRTPPALLAFRSCPQRKSPQGAFEYVRLLLWYKTHSR